MAKKFKTKEDKEILVDSDGERLNVFAHYRHQLQVKALVANAKLPTRAHPNDAGLDLYAHSETKDPQGRFVEYDTGIAVAIPEGYVGLLCPRSSISNTSLMLRNSVGILDSGYQGPITFRFKRLPDCKGLHFYNIGDRIGQLVIVPILLLDPVFVDELPKSDRGTGGYGSTGV